MLIPIALGAIAAIIVTLSVFVARLYNNLVQMRNRYLNAFSQIQVQLKRRHDLIPNLVEATRAFMTHENDTLESVIAARNTATAGLKAAQQQPNDAAVMANLAGAENALTGALGRFSMVVESYPELKANENVMYLSEELTSTENKIGFSRQLYNDLVTIYNTTRQTFPAVLVVSHIGHAEDAATLEFDDQPAIQDAPQIALMA